MIHEKNRGMSWVGYICEKQRIPKYEFLKMQKSLFLQILSWKLPKTAGNQRLSNDNSWEQIIGLYKGVKNENCIFSVWIQKISLKPKPSQIVKPNIDLTYK